MSQAAIRFPPRPPNRKKIFIILAVVLGFFLVIGVIGALWLGGVHRTYKQQQAIEQVYQKHNAAALAFRDRVKKQMPLSANYDRMAADMLAIDLAGCPNDFQERYVAVIKAFGNISVDVKNETGIPGIVRALSEASRVDLKASSDDLKSIDRAMQQYKDSLLDLAQCAREHGMTVH